MNRTALVVAALAASLTLAVFFAARFSTAHAQNAGNAGIEGKWQGVLGSGAHQLHIELEFYKLPSGALAGDLNSVEQGATLPINAVDFQGDQLHFEIHRIGGVYQGTLGRDGAHIQGTWVQTGMPPQPLNFQRAGTQTQQAPAATAPPAPTTKPFTAPLVAEVPIVPTAFAAGGKAHLVYELHVTNYTRYDSAIAKVEVLAADSDTALASFSGQELEDMILRPGLPEVKPKSKLAAGTTAVIFLWVDFPGLHDVPGEVRHRITMSYAAYPEPVIAVTAPLHVNRKPVMVVSPPLRGDDWLAANGPSNVSLHRRAIIPIDGSARIAQRFAIDWVRLFPDGGSYQGDAADNHSYRAYGAEALACAEGTVVETKDGIPQNVPGVNSRAEEITLENVAGNHVVLNLGNGIYALYAHLQPGSLKVQPGDKVRRGQVLGLVGNSGNSTEPHLHFHLCDAPSALACEGVPFAFAQFEVLGRGWGWRATAAQESPVVHTHEMPLENDVVAFPQETKSLIPHLPK
jgi:murein DD-endopeptidase